MNTQTVLLIILAVLISLGLVLFQYFYRTKKRGKLSIFLSFLRFLGVFGLLLLLINPKFSKNEYSLEKTNLILLADNSSSVAKFGSDIVHTLNKIRNDNDINKRFNIQSFSFGSTLNDSDSLHFDERNSNLSNSLSSLNEIFGNSNTATVVITDGNQTIGQDYTFTARNYKSPLFPLTIGDTTTYEDVRISQINVNKYAFLKNKFPVEVFLVYEGKNNINAEVTININKKNVFKEKVFLSNSESTKTINTLLSANSIGVKSIQVSVKALENERNVNNNTKNAYIEVIDEKTNIYIISELLHPDIGALKKSIESNEQRSVSLTKPSTPLKRYDDADVLILYQPNPSFREVYQLIEQRNLNTFTITGEQTDWNFLNNIQKSFSKDSYNQPEDVFPILNKSFDIFNLGDFSTLDFPPLKTELGEITLNNSFENILNQQVKGVDINQPLLVIFQPDKRKNAVLFGQDIWKWRVQSFRNDSNFTNFDGFIGKLILYLASTEPKSRLSIDYQPIYQGTNEAKISATFFDEAFIFNPNAALQIKLTNKSNNTSRDIPMLLRGNYYEADLTDLTEGNYDFTVKVLNENYSRSGSFIIEGFDVEKQFLSSNFVGLNQIAESSNGELFFPNQIDELLEKLNTDTRFVPTQKSVKNVVSLIDFRILLGIIVAALSLEWFIRKYNGLI